VKNSRAREEYRRAKSRPAAMPGRSRSDHTAVRLVARSSDAQRPDMTAISGATPHIEARAANRQWLTDPQSSRIDTGCAPTTASWRRSTAALVTELRHRQASRRDAREVKRLDGTADATPPHRSPGSANSSKRSGGPTWPAPSLIGSECKPNSSAVGVGSRQ